MTVLDRFWSKVALGDPDACWEWLAARNANGYGRFRVGGRAENGGKVIMAHRFAYELRAGPVPRELELDHLCSNRACVNHAHLEAVTHKENSLRTCRTHCKRGHKFTPESTYVDSTGDRECLVCMRLRRAAYYEKTGR